MDIRLNQMRFVIAASLARFRAWSFGFVFAGVIAFAFTSLSEDSSAMESLSVMELQGKLAGAQQLRLSCRVEGFIRAIVPERNLVAVQDASGVALLELPGSISQFHVGDGIRIEAANNLFTQTRSGIRVEEVPLIDHFGLHSATEKSGSIFLGAGINPIRLDWFNGPAEFDLHLEIEGPELGRQPIPNSWLWHYAGEETGASLQSGLQYRAYEAVFWSEFFDWSVLDFTSAGVATNFTVDYRTSNENCGISFNGLLRVEHSGIYQFHLRSDDGSRLYVGAPAVMLQKKEGVMALPATESLERALANRSRNHWVKLEGEVCFESQCGRDLYLELLAGGERVPVSVIEGSRNLSTNLLWQRIQVEGVGTFSRVGDENKFVGVFVPGTALVQAQNADDKEHGDEAKQTLTTISQVRRLKTAEAGEKIPVMVQGVVIFASSTAMVLEDGGDGVFISNGSGYWPRQPKLGEVWKIRGVTDAGLFSPVITADAATFIGFAPLPEPVHPTLDQLINGNMDAEYGELQGVVSSISNNEVILLTPDGKVGIVGSSDRPLPSLAKLFSGNISPVGSVVRVRGCFAPMVDLVTRQVIPRKTFIYPAQVEVEEATPPDPFKLPMRLPSDLMWFNARALALQRTKLAGQIVYSRPGEYLVLAGKCGFRVLTLNTSLGVGDLIEAVGFPKLDGPSPILQEAIIRKTGSTELPSPTIVPPEKLLNRELDSTLVQITALIVSDSVHPGERVLELQSGSQQFAARMKSSKAFAPLPAGCRVQLTGIYASAYSNRDRANAQIAPFEILINKYADIVILQRPPWWTIKRIVVALGIVVALLGIMFGWVVLLRRRVEQRTVELKREIEQRQFVEQCHAIELERTRVARDLHDELGAGLTEVGLLGALANTSAIAPEMKSQHLDRITLMARSLVTSLDEIVWAVNPHYDSVPSLVSYFSLYAESFLGHADVNYRLKVAEHIPASPLDSKQRHGFFCAFKEALNNVVRHAKASEVLIAFEVTENQLTLSVVDNGCGFDLTPTTPGGDGLVNLRQRMKELGGGCEIKSCPGRGTTVRIHLPLN